MKYKDVNPETGQTVRGQYVEYYNDNRPMHVVDSVTVKVFKADPRNLKLFSDWLEKQKGC